MASCRTSSRHLNDIRFDMNRFRLQFQFCLQHKISCIFFMSTEFYEKDFSLFRFFFYFHCVCCLCSAALIQWNKKQHKRPPKIEPYESELTSSFKCHNVINWSNIMWTWIGDYISRRCIHFIRFAVVRCCLNEVEPFYALHAFLFAAHYISLSLCFDIRLTFDSK